jgi:hypothetical protein
MWREKIYAYPLGYLSKTDTRHFCLFDANFTITGDTDSKQQLIGWGHQDLIGC